MPSFKEYFDPFLNAFAEIEGFEAFLNEILVNGVESFFKIDCQDEAFLSKIVDIARKVIEEGDMSEIGKLAEMMQVHESQQSASIIATIATLVGSKLHDDVDVVYREAIGDVIMWDTPVIKSNDDWPSRKKYVQKKMFDSREDLTEMKMVVHGYLGYKASKEMEQFLTVGELRRIAHYEDGVWIAPTRSTFKSYLPDVFPEKPYIIHQNSPLA